MLNTIVSKNYKWSLCISGWVIYEIKFAKLKLIRRLKLNHFEEVEAKLSVPQMGYDHESSIREVGLANNVILARELHQIQIGWDGFQSLSTRPQ